MRRKMNNGLPEKDYAIWLGLGLILLIISQYFSKQPGTFAAIIRWLFMVAAVINYGSILYLYDRDRKAKKEAAQDTPAAENKE